MATSREIHLAARPHGVPQPTDFALVEVDVPEPAEGEVLIRNAFMSVDPSMRPRMNDVKSYLPPFQVGEVMSGGAVGQVVASRNERVPEGSWVTNWLGWRELALSDGRGLMPVDPAVAPVSTALGVLGMPGLTAYVGLLDIGRPQAGETVYVSGAAGAVGSARRADREAEGLPGDRQRGIAREGRVAAGARVRRGVRLPRDRRARGAARGHRPVLRQRRRRDARGGALGAAPARPRRRLRRDLAVQRHGAAAGAEEHVLRRHQAAAHRGVHRDRPLRPVPRVPRRGRPVGARREGAPTARRSSTGSRTLPTPCSACSAARTSGRCSSGSGRTREPALQALRPQGAEGAVVLPHRAVPALRALRRARAAEDDGVTRRARSRSDATYSCSAAGPSSATSTAREPTTMPSVRSAAARACSGVEIPKPA